MKKYFWSILFFIAMLYALYAAYTKSLGGFTGVMWMAAGLLLMAFVLSILFKRGDGRELKNI